MTLRIRDVQTNFAAAEASYLKDAGERAGKQVVPTERRHAVIKVKNLFDGVEPDDGVRLFVEPSGLTLDLVEWCAVHHVLSNVAPPKRMTRSLEAGPERYPEFRGQYHEWLSESKFVPALDELARAAQAENYTLLHTGDDPEHNVATALAEYLAERQGWKNTA